MSKKTTLATNITVLREVNSLTQTEFSAHLGISRERYASYEEGRAKPSIEMFLRISGFYNISPHNLFHKKFTKENVDDEETPFVNDVHKIKSNANVAKIKMKLKEIVKQLEEIVV